MFITLTDSLTQFGNAFKEVMMVLTTSNFAKAVDAQFIAIQDNINGMIDLLNKYADALENAATRVETAVVSRAIPAIAQARREGASDIAKAETIATVKIRDKEEKSDSERSVVVEAINSIGLAIKELVTTMIDGSSTSDAKREEIIDILNQYLPDLANRRNISLGDKLNSWES